MRDKHADGAAVDRAAQRPHQIIERCLQRPSDAHLRHDDGRQDRPQRQGKLQELRERESRQCGDRHPDGKCQLHAAMMSECAEVPPESCDAFHADYP